MIAMSDIADDQGRQRTPTEAFVGNLWKQVLQTTAAPATEDNFFELGGDSIGMAIVLFRIQEKFSIVLPPDVMFSAPTLGDLAELVNSIVTSPQ